MRARWSRLRRAATVLGLLLFGGSAYPLALMAREEATRHYVANDYLIEGVYNSLTASIGSHTVRLEDDLPVSPNPDDRATTRVRIMVDGRDYGTAVEAVARPSFRDANRYHGYVSLMRLTDRHSGTTTVVIAQTLGVPPGTRGYDKQRFRVLALAGDGTVTEETFTYPERSAPAVRARLIAGVVPHPVGYYSDLMQVWPSLWYPLLFPWASGLVGAVLLALSWLFHVRGSKAKSAAT